MSTKIEWAEETWSPITGCTKISPGCQNCYAERMAQRLKGRFGYPEDEPFRPGTWHDDRLDQPFSWRKPRLVFVCSMGDLFHDDVTVKMMELVMWTMLQANQHTYLLLTKRPELMRQFMVERSWEVRFKGAHGLYTLTGWPPRHIWLGVTAENQEQLNRRGRILMQIEAAKHFVSYEPALGPLDISPDGAPYFYYNDLTHGEPVWCGPDWFICGGESGGGARPMHPDWARQVRDQCKAAGVPFFMKQMSGRTKAERKAIPEDLMIQEYPNA